MRRSQCDTTSCDLTEKRKPAEKANDVVMALKISEANL